MDRGALALCLIVLLLLATSCQGSTKADRAVIENGRLAYMENCASCHGANGEGQPDWKIPRPDGSYSAPPHDSTGHTWHHGDGLLFHYVKYGGASLEIPAFVSGMPAFAGKLSDEEIKAVILYLKTLWGAKEREFQAQVSEQDPFQR